MKSLCWLALTLLAPLADAAPRLEARAQLLPADSAVVGQTVELQLDVLTDTWFTRAPQLPTLDLPDALVLPPDDQAQHLTLKEGDQTLYGMRYTWRITPQVAQRLSIPALTVQATPGQSAAPLSARSPPLQLDIHLPVGAVPGQPLLVAQALSFSQQLRYSHTPPRVGDSVTRTLVLQADGALSLSLPAPALAEVPGLNRYLITPQVLPLDDGHGHLRGAQRIDSARYRIDQAGALQLPAIELHWWDAASQQAAVARLPAVAFTAQPAAVVTPVFALDRSFQRLHLARYWPGVLGACALLAAFAYCARPHLAHYRRRLLCGYRAVRRFLAPRELRPLNPRLDKDCP